MKPTVVEMLMAQRDALLFGTHVNSYPEQSYLPDDAACAVAVRHNRAESWRRMERTGAYLPYEPQGYVDRAAGGKVWEKNDNGASRERVLGWLDEAIRAAKADDA